MDIEVIMSTLIPFYFSYLSSDDDMYFLVFSGTIFVSSSLPAHKFEYFIGYPRFPFSCVFLQVVFFYYFHFVNQDRLAWVLSSSLPTRRESQFFGIRRLVDVAGFKLSPKNQL